MSTLLQLGSRPREGLNAERPGSYAPAIRLKRSRVDRREFVEGDVFITGYGQIEGAKLVFYPSTGVFDQDLSSFRFGFEQVQESLIFGGQEKQSGEDGITISLTGGILAETWSRPTLFFDAVKGDLPIIATEMKQMRAPISFRLGVGDKARPGEYQQQFILTYFDGVNWRTSSATTSVVVRNILQRYEIPAAVLAGGAAIATILASIASTVRSIILFFH